MVQRAYRIDAIDRLRAEQLRSAPLEDRVRRIDRIELAISDLDAANHYAVDRIVKTIGCGGWVPRDRDKAPGADLIHDLRLLVEDLSDSVDLPASAVGEQVLTVEDLARQFNVSTKTIARWREAGLVSRRLVFDGRKRVGFLRSSVDRFVRANRDRVERGAKFRQMTDTERRELVAEARRVAADEGLDLNAVARRLTDRTGRTAETIRQTLRQHAEAHPDEQPFDGEGAVLAARQREQIEADFRAGIAVEKLADRYGRSKTTIYRIATEVRYERIRALALESIPNPRFARKGADAACLGEMPVAETPPRRVSRPTDLPAYLAALYDSPLLTREQEQHLFRQYNYLKFKAAKLRATLDAARPKAVTMDEIEALHERAVEVKNQIARANLRLVVSLAKKRMGPTQSFFELVSDGNVSLMKAIEKFDFARGNKFSTYATWAIVKNYARSIPNEYKHQDRFRTSTDELFASAEEHRANPLAHEAAQADREHKIRRILRRLDEREQQIVISRFGLDHNREPLTLKEVGAQMGVTKERVRQIEVRALDKLRVAAAEERVQLDF
ncbi:sigma-70 family RNA polymerase sigma factor [Botrimarina hoheduenensis]|uniref:RNA polymerase sigma factor SigB n=1 Tax=Botrimarina hoheduenensis TaxID=2528000 RepID=A0A5C5W7G3_9BACT|nr:sigma-70 family RNA polymerase sigma factor [Botrimarina hoheduenensis]TWT46620.1 RNA polymerase sigma factor SigB [Botrimarina hoheduenensis]